MSKQISRQEKLGQGLVVQQFITHSHCVVSIQSITKYLKLAPSLNGQCLSATCDYINSPELELAVEELAGQPDLFALFVSLLLSPCRVPYSVSRLIPILVTAITANFRDPHRSECPALDQDRECPVLYLSTVHQQDLENLSLCRRLMRTRQIDCCAFHGKGVAESLIFSGIFFFNPVGSFEHFIKVKFIKSFRMLLGNKNTQVAIKFTLPII